MAHAIFRRMLAPLAAVLLVTACTITAPQAPVADTGGLQIDILNPSAGEAVQYLVVQLADADGNPVTDATVALEGDMNHAGMVPVIADAVSDDADGSADGRYHVPFGFTMLGDWILTVNVTQADGSTVSRAINAQVTESAVTIEGAPMTMHHDDAHAESVHLMNVRARPAPLVGGNAAVYFLLHNPTDAAITLVGGETPAAARVEVHETVQEGDIMRMRQLENGLRVEPGATATLEPGGLHVMLVELVEVLEEGDEFELTLVFDNGEELVLQVPVMPIEGSMGGHSH